MSTTISENLEVLTDKLDETIKKFDAKILAEASVPIDELLEEIRKTVQDKLRDPIERLVQKLKNDEPLSPEEMRLVEKWVIGDAEFYTRIENNLLDWMVECKRLFSVLEHYKNEGIEESENNLLGLGALLTDLKFTLSDVIRYSKAMNRVDEFKTMTRGGIPTAETKKLIAERIEEKLAENE